MKETGLMFKAPLVHAILAGQKTQTRRVVTPQPALCTHDAWPTNWVVEGCEWHCAVCGNGNRLNPRAKSGVSGINCPMGQPGDRIYVRETFNHFERNEDFKEGCECFYRADGDCVDLQPWRPAIHMPKHAARIWLEITGVRVERLQSITEADLAREGIQEYIDKGVDHDGTPRDTFRKLWETTGGDWPANPWVWVIDFKTISTTGRPA